MTKFIFNRTVQKIMLGVVMLAGAFHAVAEGLAWSELTPPEQRVLLPFADKWDSMDAATKQKLREGAKRWATMNTEQKREASERFERWQRTTPEERERIRQGYQRFRQLPLGEQQRIRQGFKRFNNLRPDERQQMRRRFERMSPAEKRAFMQGAQAGQRAQALGAQQSMPPALRHLPLEERERTIKLMESLTFEQRQIIRARMQMVDDIERERLRKELLNATPEQRDAIVKDIEARNSASK